MPVLVSPDKSTRFGCWSNDSPEAMRALCYTNHHALVRASLLNYLRYPFNSDGILTWYLHGTGVAALGNPGDVGRLSHGMPAIVPALAAYVQNTGDTRACLQNDSNRSGAVIFCAAAEAKV